MRWRYPKNWEKIKKGVYEIYGGKYCLKIGYHKGAIQIHHYIPLSDAIYTTEYYFLNEPWNLVMLCARHHSKMHPNNSNIKGLDKNYKPFKKSEPKIGWLHRFYWYLKRHWYHSKFERRKEEGGTYKILFFWNYTKWGIKRRKKKMQKSLEGLLD